MGNIRLYASQNFIELLSGMNHQIAKTLLHSILSKESQRISYLDFGNVNDNISYVINNKFEEIINNNPDNWKELVWTEKRTNLKIGKFIKMLYGDQFPVNQIKGQIMPRTPNDIESFVNIYKFERDKNINYNRFEIVRGDDIRHWYSQENYNRYANNETTLGKSCMRYAESGKFLNMYTQNPQIFSMLILKDDRGKLKGRAIIWDLMKPEGRKFLDRIYTVNDHDVESFKNYAKEQGWLYRYQQCFGWFNKIVDPTINKIIDQRDILLEAHLDKIPETHYNYYPYLDTLSIYNKKTHILSNDGSLRTKSGHLLLTDYQGHFHSEVDERERVYSEIYAQDILEEDSIFVEIDQSYIYRNDAVYVHNSGGKQAFKNSNKIVKCKLPGKDTKFFLKEDAVWSGYLDTFIHKESVREAFLDPQKTKPVLIHYRMIGKNFVKRDGSIFYEKKTESKSKLINDLTSMSPEELKSRFGTSDIYQIFRNVMGKSKISDISDRNYDYYDNDNDEISGEESDGNPLRRNIFSSISGGRYSDVVRSMPSLSELEPSSARPVRINRDRDRSLRPEPVIHHNYDDDRIVSVDGGIRLSPRDTTTPSLNSTGLNGNEVGNITLQQSLSGESDDRMVSDNNTIGHILHNNNMTVNRDYQPVEIPNYQSLSDINHNVYQTFYDMWYTPQNTNYGNIPDISSDTPDTNSDVSDTIESPSDTIERPY